MKRRTLLAAGAGAAVSFARWTGTLALSGPRRAAVVTGGLVAGGLCGTVFEQTRTDRVARRVVDAWTGRGTPAAGLCRGGHLWRCGCANGVQDPWHEPNWWQARQVARYADRIGLPADTTVAWAAAGLVRPEHRIPSRWFDADGPARWVRLGPAATVWRAAGYAPAEAARLAALPAGHPDRPSAQDLAVQACLCPPEEPNL